MSRKKSKHRKYTKSDKRITGRIRKRNKKQRKNCK